MVGDILTLFMLIMLQAVLGFDNLLYISIESKRAPEDKQPMVRAWGIGLAIALRIILLFALIRLFKFFEKPFFELDWVNVVEGQFTIHSVIVLLGGGFILYTAVKEIWHMVYLEEHGQEDVKPKSILQVITMIVLMNIVFSFDSILSAMALTDVEWVMATAIIISGVMMIWLSGKVTEFLKRNRMFEVLGLFVLFLVGVMILSEGGHDAHLKFFGYEVVAMSKSTFYFVFVVLVIVDVIQGRYQKKLIKAKESEGEH